MAICIYKLSPQQLISSDYDLAVGLEGCNGGDIYVALSALVEVSTYLIVVKVQTRYMQMHSVPHLEHVETYTLVNACYIWL